MGGRCFMGLRLRRLSRFVRVIGLRAVEISTDDWEDEHVNSCGRVSVAISNIEHKTSVY